MSEQNVASVSPNDTEALATALRELEKAHRQFAEHAREGMWIIDANAVTTFVTARMAEMLGYTADEMVGTPLDAFMDEQGKKIADRNIERRRQGIKEQHDFELIRKDGTRIYTSMDTAPTFDDQGTYAGAIAFVFDVSEQRRAEDRVRHLAAIVESVGDAILSATLDGRITSWNQGAELLFGYSQQEALGRRFADFIPERLRGSSRELFRRAVAGETVVEHDTSRLNKDGVEIPVSITLSALPDAEGEVIGLAAIVRNTSERLEAERSLEASNRLLTSIIDCAGEGIFVKGADLRYRRANDRATQMMGLEPEDIVGKTDADIAPPEIASARRERDESVMREQRSMSREYPVITSDGKELFVAETKSPLFDSEAEGQVSGVVGVIRDITEVKRAHEERSALEAQMLHVQKLESLGLLAGGIAHDFNNLLVSILGNADLAAMELAPASPVQEDLAAIITASRRASELCRQLLAYSGRGRFVVKPIDLSKAVQEMSGLLEVSLSKRAILQLDLSDLPVVLEADVTQLRQILMNLISNASEAMEERGGVIRVTTGTTTVDADYLKSCVTSDDLEGGTYGFVEVSDTGSGMPRETLDKIFDPFFSTKFTGRGLGLAAVLGIVRGHGGAIRVYSEPDRGSSFKVLFPLADTSMEESSKASSKPAAALKGVMLVIDDDKSVLQFANRALTRSGYEVITAGSGEEGIVRFRAERHRITAVLLDMTMPGMDGRETFSELRKLDDAIPVILSSGFNEQETTSQLAGRGLAGFLAKPYSVQELLGCLREAIGTAQP